MKKFDLLHLTFLIIAILSGYSAVQNLISLLTLLPYLPGPLTEFTYRGTYFMFMVGGHAIVCVVLIRNGRKYAAALLKNDPEGTWEDAPRWDLDRHNMLFILFVGLGLHTIIYSGADVLGDCIELFSEKVDYTTTGHYQKRVYLIADLLRLTIGACVVYAAPTLTNSIEHKIAIRLDSSQRSST
jgi:hypothetical protein